MRLLSSATNYGEQIGEIFQKSLIDGLIQGFWIFMNSGGWWLLALVIAFFIIETLVKRAKRRR